MDRHQAGDAGASSGGKRVCCLLDGSMNSFDALRWALDHAIDLSDDVYLVTVDAWEDFVSNADTVLKEAYEVAHNAGARLHPRRVHAAHTSTTRGVAEAAHSFVLESGADLLVMGSRGLGSMQRSLMGSLGMGSVSDHLLQRVACPVLVVRGQQAQQAQQVQVQPEVQ